MLLNTFSNIGFDRGASRLRELLWLLTSGVLFETFIPGSAWRVFLLRVFGASIGSGVVIKPRVRIKFPWKLVIGDYCWIGEDVWLDNLETVSVSSHVCISQGAYFCTGSHDWSKSGFDLIVKPIVVGSHAWVGAMSRVAPGVAVGDGAILGFGSVARNDLKEWTVYFGTPAVPVKVRDINSL